MLLLYIFHNFIYQYTGHDKSESLLRRNEGSDCQPILLGKLNDEELSSLAFLFGGVGDGRHVFATLLDAQNQYKSLSDEKREKFRLHMTLNDIRLVYVNSIHALTHHRD
jgi:hypothetical protein